MPEAIRKTQKPPVKVTPRSEKLEIPPQHGDMLDEAVSTQFLRHAWTRERAAFLQRMGLGSMVMNLVLVVVLCLMALRPVDSLYFWTDGNGTIRPLIPLNEPVLSDSERANWVTQAVTQSFGMDFTNFRSQMQAFRPNFTPEGFEAFARALQDSSILPSIITNKYILSAVPRAAPLELRRGTLPDGRFSWQYQMPVLLTYQASSQSTTQEVVIEIVVVRVREVDNPRGMAIARFQAR